MGLCHAENEQDTEAIAAFKRSLELDPLNRRTLLASAVSLANEGLESSALCHLDQWISIFNNNSASTAFVNDSFLVNDSWIQKVIFSIKL